MAGEESISFLFLEGKAIGIGDTVTNLYLC